jgi:hypothetical protein
MSSINIDLWLQDAIEYRLKEHVKKTVEDRIPETVERDKWFNTRITEVTHSYGHIDVGWTYQTNSRAPKTRENGTESFTLAEVLRICMMEEKEEEE